MERSSNRSSDEIMSPTLKRGVGLSYYGKDWEKSNDSKWELSPYVPWYGEPLIGRRYINETECMVFKCRDDSYFAQPVHICEMPIPDDVMTVFDTFSEETEKSNQVEKAKKNSPVKALAFQGKNWKLASDRKWVESLVFTSGESVGKRTIFGSQYEVYKTGSGFAAVKVTDET